MPFSGRATSAEGSTPGLRHSSLVGSSLDSLGSCPLADRRRMRSVCAIALPGLPVLPVSLGRLVLGTADYIACTKSFEGRMPKTQYRLTDKGRRALEKYLDHMEALIRAMREC